MKALSNDFPRYSNHMSDTEDSGAIKTALWISAAIASATGSALLLIATWALAAVVVFDYVRNSGK